MAIALCGLMPFSVIADVEKDITPSDVRTVYQGLTGSPAKDVIPQGAVSRARRYEQRFLPSDLQGQQHAIGNIETTLYNEYDASIGSSVRGTPGIAFGWPPSAVRQAYRLGVIEHSTQKGIQTKLGTGAKQPSFKQVRLTEKPVAGLYICCDREIIELNHATNYGKCDLTQLRKPGNVQSSRLFKLDTESYYKSIVKSACGSNPGYRYAFMEGRITKCDTTDMTLCQVPAGGLP